MSEEDYEILPHQEVENLRTEVEKLKSSALVGTKEENRLNANIQVLNSSITKLYNVFESVRKDILQDFETKQRPEDLLAKLIEQNKTIAESLIVLSHKIDDLESKKEEKASSPENKPKTKIIEQEDIEFDDMELNSLEEELAKKEASKPPQQSQNEDKIDDTLEAKNSTDDFDEPIPKPDPIKLNEEQKSKRQGFTGLFKK